MKGPQHTPERLALRPAEAAKAVGVCERTFREALPRIPHVRFGRAVVVPIESLRRWLREQAEGEDAAIAGVADEILAGLRTPDV